MLGFAVANATGMLDARSPGERPEGALVQTKAPRRRLAAAPESRVLSESRFKPGVPAEPDLSSDLPVSAIPESIGAPVPLAGTEGGPGPLPAAVPAAPGGTPLVTTDVTVTTPVPEPGTYLLFAFGIGIVGLVHRRRRIAARGDADKEASRPAAE